VVVLQGISLSHPRGQAAQRLLFHLCSPGYPAWPFHANFAKPVGILATRLKREDHMMPVGPQAYLDENCGGHFHTKVLLCHGA